MMRPRHQLLFAGALIMAALTVAWFSITVALAPPPLGG